MTAAKVAGSVSGASSPRSIDHRFYDQIIATQLAAGITKTVLHGWASTAGTEGATEWPGHEGMWPMFSERFDSRQPSSEFYPLWNNAIGRFQYLLRQGRPRIDIGLLRTDHFVDNMSGMMLVNADGNRVADEDAYGQLWMRNRENHWWQDLGMQDAGWSYEFFDGSLLAHPEVRFGDGFVQPDGPGYQALIVYQEALDPDVAALLLDWAGQGLKVLIVNGARELKYLLRGEYTTHHRAATRTPGLDGRDDELNATLNDLRALPNVTEIDDPASTVSALRGLGVTGRAEFVTDNPNVLTYLREEGDLVHLYAYHFLYETGAPTEVEITVRGHGAVYRVDAWSGAVLPHSGVRTEGDRTVLTITLSPGEPALFTIDRSVPAVESPVADSAVIADLDTWTISVESWDAGELELITEDRGLGYETREVRPTTAITTIHVAGTALRPWTELPEVGPEVSGVGVYSTIVELDAAAADGARYVLDLGSTSGGLGSVSVNGHPARGFDTSRPVVDVTDQLKPGRNEIVVRAASSLNNRLIARGYYEKFPDVLGMIMGREAALHETRVREYGLVGPVRLLQDD